MEQLLRTCFRQVTTRLTRGERGSTLVYGAVILIGVLSVSALAIDGSNAYLQRREMQTAADAAALAGAHVLASGGSDSQVAQEVGEIAALNDAVVESLEIEDNHIVRVTVGTEVQTYLAKIVDIDVLNAKASAAASFEPIPDLKSPPPLCFDVSCLTQYDSSSIIGDEVATYCADSFQHYRSGPISSLYIHNPEPDNEEFEDMPYWQDDFREFMRIGSIGVFEEYTDGTARLSMEVQNAHNRGFEMNLWLSGRTSTPPNSSSPYLTTATVYADTTDWYYYSEWSGTLTGLSGTLYQGAEINIYGAGAAFQVGKGATYYRGDLFGAAGWAWLYVTQQPSTGIELFEDGWSASDVYFYFDRCNYLQGTFTASESDSENACKFTWLDWNGDMETSEDVADNISDSSVNGTQPIGQWVPAGPWGNDVQELEDALSEWTGQTVPVAVCDEKNDNDEYPIAGFTGFNLESLDFSAFPKQISGRFEPIVINSSSTSDPMIDYLARDIHLIE